MKSNLLDDLEDSFNFESQKSEITPFDLFEDNNISSLIPIFEDIPTSKNESNQVSSYIYNEHKYKLSPLFKIIKVKNRTIFENEINGALEKMNITEKKFFLNSNNHCDEIEKIRNKLKVNKKRTKKLLKDVNLTKQTKRGRKKKDDASKGCHNKFSSDNIIKSIKTKINSSLILFINKIINSIYNIDEINQICHSLNLPEIKFNSTSNEVFKKNNYNNRVNSEDKFHDINLLNCTIKDYFSSEISIKYKCFPNNYNELIINYLLNDVNYKNIFNFLFNITIGDWLNIFIYKKEINELTYFNSLKEIDINIIKSNLVRIDEYLKDIYEKDKNYYHCFMLLIYNFKRYFEFKERRIRKKK